MKPLRIEYHYPRPPNKKLCTSWTLWKMTLTYDVDVQTHPGFVSYLHNYQAENEYLQ